MVTKLKLTPNTKLSNDTLRKFYTNLLTMSFPEAGCSIGLDKQYTNMDTIRKKSWLIYQSINPDELGISRDIVLAVREAIERRKGGLNKIQDKTPLEVANEADISDLVLKGANKAGAALHKKLELILRSRKALQDTPLSQLATAFGILFDKRQILTGQATENIAVMAKVSKDMSPEDTLSELMKMRDFNNERSEVKSA